MEPLNYKKPDAEKAENKPKAKVADAATPAAANKKRASLGAYLKSKEFWISISGLVLFSFLILVLFFYVLLPSLTQHGETVDVPKVESDLASKQFVKLDEAIKRLEDKGLKYEVIDSSQFLPAYPALAIIGQEPTANSPVKPGRKVYLKVNKTVAPQVKFPDLTDVSFNQARYTLENWKLKLGTVRTKPGLGDNLVLAAYHNGKQLSPNDLVAEQSVIDLDVSKSIERKKIAMPKVVGLSMPDAFAALQAQGLLPRKRMRVGGGAQGMVVKQIPAYKDSVVAGSVVIIEVVK